MQRRTMLESLGVGMFGFAGTAHARSASTGRSAAEAGVDAEVESLLRVGDLTAAERLLEEHCVEERKERMALS
ncbi:MAG: hypothetical protein M8354_09840 [Halalkalicoccus sp.]|nr:hypothetical protein [Halalkalicoccus sp.]